MSHQRTYRGLNLPILRLSAGQTSSQEINISRMETELVTGHLALSGTNGEVATFKDKGSDLGQREIKDSGIEASKTNRPALLHNFPGLRLRHDHNGGDVLGSCDGVIGVYISAFEKPQVLSTRVTLRRNGRRLLTRFSMVPFDDFGPFYG